MNLFVLGLGLFVFVMATVTGAGYWMLVRKPALPRSAPSALALEPGPDLPSPKAALADLFGSIGGNFPGAKREESPLRHMLMLAGYRSPSSLPVFYGIKCGIAVLFAICAGVLTASLGRSLAGSIIPMLCFAGLGFLLPDRVLRARANGRIDRLRRGLPAALDLMVLGVEAGVALDQVILDTSRGLRNPYPELSSEFTQLYGELRTGVSRSDAFRNLADRNGDSEMRKLATVLTDSDRFGTSLGPALRNHARYLRTRFRQKAQERARKVGAKLIFPVFFLIFPAVLLVTLVPACLSMYAQMKHMLG